MRRLAVSLRCDPAAPVRVGEVAEHGRRVFFELDAGFLSRGLELSPFKLQARAGLLEHRASAFGTLPGLFADSVPDAWGCSSWTARSAAGG